MAHFLMFHGCTFLCRNDSYFFNLLCNARFMSVYKYQLYVQVLFTIIQNKVILQELLIFNNNYCSFMMPI